MTGAWGVIKEEYDRKNLKNGNGGFAKNSCIEIDVALRCIHCRTKVKWV